MMAMPHVSNSLGTINPVEKIAAAARREGVMLLIDGAQGAPHLPVDVQAIGCDFYAFSSHKMLGPTGIGVLYGRPELLEEMQPFLGGGEMIRKVTFEGATWNDLPWKFEAGTPNIADAIAFGAAIDYLTDLGMENVREHEIEITEYALRPPAHSWTTSRSTDRRTRASVAASSRSTSNGVHPHDVGTVLDRHGVAIRAGHHCTQPLMALARRDPASARASFYVYNTLEEVDVLVEAICGGAGVLRRWQVANAPDGPARPADYKQQESELDDLYRDIIIDHYRNPRHKGRLDRTDCDATRG